MIRVLPDVGVSDVCHYGVTLVDGKVAERLDRVGLAVLAVVRLVVVEIRVERRTERRDRNILDAVIVVVADQLLIEEAEICGRERVLEVADVLLLGCAVIPLGGVPVVDGTHRVLLHRSRVGRGILVDVSKVEIGVNTEVPSGRLHFLGILHQLPEALLAAHCTFPLERRRYGVPEAPVGKAGQAEVDVGDSLLGKIPVHLRDIVKSRECLVNRDRDGEELLGRLNGAEGFDVKRDMLAVHVFLGQAGERFIADEVIAVDLCHADVRRLVVGADARLCGKSRIGKHHIAQGKVTGVFPVRNDCPGGFLAVVVLCGNGVGQLVGILRTRVEVRTCAVVIALCAGAEHLDRRKRLALLNDNEETVLVGGSLDLTGQCDVIGGIVDLLHNFFQRFLRAGDREIVVRFDANIVLRVKGLLVGIGVIDLFLHQAEYRAGQGLLILTGGNIVVSEILAVDLSADGRGRFGIRRIEVKERTRAVRIKDVTGIRGVARSHVRKHGDVFQRVLAGVVPQTVGGKRDGKPVLIQRVFKSHLEYGGLGLGFLVHTFRVVGFHLLEGVVRAVCFDLRFDPVDLALRGVFREDIELKVAVVLEYLVGCQQRLAFRFGRRPCVAPEVVHGLKAECVLLALSGISEPFLDQIENHMLEMVLGNHARHQFSGGLLSDDVFHTDTVLDVLDAHLIAQRCFLKAVHVLGNAVGRAVFLVLHNDLGHQLGLGFIGALGGGHIIRVGENGLAGRLLVKRDLAGHIVDVESVLIGFDVRRHHVQLLRRRVEPICVITVVILDLDFGIGSCGMGTDGKQTAEPADRTHNRQKHGNDLIGFFHLCISFQLWRSGPELQFRYDIGNQADQLTDQRHKQDRKEHDADHADDRCENRKEIFPDGIIVRHHGAEEEQDTEPDERDHRKHRNQRRLGHSHEVGQNGRGDNQDRDGKQRIGGRNEDVLEAALAVKQGGEAPVCHHEQNQRNQNGQRLRQKRGELSRRIHDIADTHRLIEEGENGGADEHKGRTHRTAVLMLEVVEAVKGMEYHVEPVQAFLPEGLARLAVHRGCLVDFLCKLEELRPGKDHGDNDRHKDQNVLGHPVPANLRPGFRPVLRVVCGFVVIKRFLVSAVAVKRIADTDVRRVIVRVSLEHALPAFHRKVVFHVVFGVERLDNQISVFRPVVNGDTVGIAAVQDQRLYHLGVLIHNRNDVSDAAEHGAVIAEGEEQVAVVVVGVGTVTLGVDGRPGSFGTDRDIRQLGNTDLFGRIQRINVHLACRGPEAVPLHNLRTLGVEQLDGGIHTGQRTGGHTVFDLALEVGIALDVNRRVNEALFGDGNVAVLGGCLGVGILSLGRGLEPTHQDLPGRHGRCLRTDESGELPILGHHDDTFARRVGNDVHAVVLIHRDGNGGVSGVIPEELTFGLPELLDEIALAVKHHDPLVFRVADPDVVLRHEHALRTVEAVNQSLLVDEFADDETHLEVRVECDNATLVGLTASRHDVDVLFIVHHHIGGAGKLAVPAGVGHVESHICVVGAERRGVRVRRIQHLAGNGIGVSLISRSRADRNGCRKQEDKRNADNGNQFSLTHFHCFLLNPSYRWSPWFQ